MNTVRRVGNINGQTEITFPLAAGVNEIWKAILSYLLSHSEGASEVK